MSKNIIMPSEEVQKEKLKSQNDRTCPRPKCDGVAMFGTTYDKGIFRKIQIDRYRCPKCGTIWEVENK